MQYPVVHFIDAFFHRISALSRNLLTYRVYELPEVPDDPCFLCVSRLDGAGHPRCGTEFRTGRTELCADLSQASNAHVRGFDDHPERAHATARRANAGVDPGFLPRTRIRTEC